MRLYAEFLLPFSFALMQSSLASAQELFPICRAPFDQLLSDRVFSRYSVPVSSRTNLKSVSPDVRSGKAHLYRTAIRDAASAGPNFANQFTLITIGCGAATVCVAITDATTGKVYFPSELSSASALLVDTGKKNVHTLNYRRSSRLIIVVGSPNERDDRAGISYYVWRAGKLNRVKFVPKEKIC